MWSLFKPWIAGFCSIATITGFICFFLNNEIAVIIALSVFYVFY